MDIYNEQIEYLTKNPNQIANDWSTGKGLFKRIGNDKYNEHYMSGCLTMIRNHPFYNNTLNDALMPVVAFINNKPNFELTKEIIEDERIPVSVLRIRSEHLPVFAEWQRKIDAMQNNS
jgi:hypothetical protein